MQMKVHWAQLECKYTRQCTTLKSCYLILVHILV